MNTRFIIAAIGAAAAGAALFSAGYILGEKDGRSKAWADAEEEMDAESERLKRLYKVGEYAMPEEKFREEKVEVLPTEPEQEQEPLDPEMLNLLKKHIDSQGYASLKDEAVEKETMTLRERLEKEGEEIDFEVVDEVSDDIEETVFEVTPGMIDPEPYLIDEADYAYGDEGLLEKITVQWYAGDRVLTDEKNEVIDDPESFVGINNLNTLGPDKRTIYVRNERIRVDFEVTYEEDSYRDVVLGYGGPIEERPRRRRPKVD